ncbi:hypothetical protein BDQ12DRAFT_680251 [Crucibulum laeve]|uniref:Uncharacterized protein n=1 Tax=Crucibulum laeve TaxID=68775 RepID=A0A5C3MFT7_9AGAR|nr:hypothetical protein BDQ12DRAFT_680251 [Crucibulum laeve]
MAPRPRFLNPHFLPESIKTVSRQELSAEDDEEIVGIANEDEMAVSRLRELIQSSLVTDQSGNVEGRKKKRRKINEEGDTCDVNMQEPVSFRLVSTTLPPLPLLLQPKPPPPPITREPDCEDTDEQADLRCQRAQMAAVDSDTIIKECTVSWPTPRTSVLCAEVSLSLPNAPLLVIQRPQPPRKTRPPVPPSELRQYPYNPDAPPPLGCTTLTKCPLIEGAFSIQPSKKRQSRHAVSSRKIERPSPTFWRPNPLYEGKCRGYAFGYPSSFIAHDEHETGIKGPRYRRDDMRTAQYPEVLFDR